LQAGCPGRADLWRLVGAGILREITGSKSNRRFRFESYLALFEKQIAATEPGGPEPAMA
jgi:hypothetical protein